MRVINGYALYITIREHYGSDSPSVVLVARNKTILEEALKRYLIKNFDDDEQLFNCSKEEAIDETVNNIIKNDERGPELDCIYECTIKEIKIYL